ncbi:unnamed protein product [Linum trigynum]|uniref:Peptidase A1 domain-containing protein n=1 Tax=Linum trigynum TaxID=586398 RepID=A0AAV2C948_9ROSI
MATTTAFSFSSSSSSFAASLAFFLLLSLKTANGDGTFGVQQQQHFYTVQLSSLFPSDSCSPAPSTKGLNKLPVFHKHGPCAQAQQLTSTKPTADEILRQDESRVRTIQSRTRKSDVRVTESTTIPAKDGSIVDSGNYIVTVGLGTPARQLSLIFDTGSDVTWTQCQPCVEPCYQQKEKIFDPSSSKTYRNVSCDAAACSALDAATANRGCRASTCVYGILYGDASFSIGFLAIEKLTLTETDVFDEFYFGCGQNNKGNFGGAAGLLGLGRNQLSLVSQTSDKYKKLFSYCLPSSPSGTGFLTFGGAATKSAVKYTPIASVAGGDNFYGIGITAISVGGKKLPVAASVYSDAGAIIDSGTVITRLPPAAYSALRSAFRKQMSKYPLAQGLSILDTCYDLSKFKNFAVPKIGFFFAGGAEVDIDAVGILYAIKPTQVCLAFAGNGDAKDVAILGNVQQQTLEVVYDGAGGRIGFASGGCK